jgi:hypothetical protein
MDEDMLSPARRESSFRGELAFSRAGTYLEISVSATEISR